MADPIHTQRLVDRLKKYGMSNYRLLKYPGAGHLIEPPYTPYSRVAYHKIVGKYACARAYVQVISFANKQ